MSDNPLSGTVNLDTSNYKAGVSELQRQVRVIESGFKATAAAMGDWDKSSEGLELRIKALSQQIGLQKQKVDELNRVYKDLVAGGKTSAKELEELQIKINKETETLNKMESELKQDKTALNNLGNESKNAGKHVEDLGNKSKKTTSLLSGLGKGLKTSFVAIGAAVASLAAIAGVAGGLIMTTINPASDLNETISKVGVVFGGAADQVLKFGEKSDQALGMSENAALSAAGTYGNLFRAMGIAEQTSANMSVRLVKLAGDLASFNNLDPTDVLDKLRSGLSGETEPLKSLGININDATLKAKAMELGFQEVNGVLEPAAKAQAAYALFLEQTSLAQGDFTRTSSGLANQQRILSSQFENLKAKLGGGLLPVVNLGAGMLSNFLGGIMPQVGQYGERLQQALTGFDTMPETSKKMLAGIVKDLLGEVPKALQGVTSILQSVLNALMGALPTLLPVAIQIITSLVQFIVDNLPMLLQAGIQILLALVNGILPMLPMLLQTAIDMILALVMGIAQALPQLIPAIAKVIPVLVTTLISNLPALINAALQLILALAQGLIAALPVLIPQVPVIVQAIFNALILALPMITQAGIRLVSMLVTGIFENLPIIGTAAGRLLRVLTDGLQALREQLLAAGIAIVLAIWDGITQKSDWFFQQIKDFFGNMLQAAKDAIGWHSPPAKFIELGAGMASALGIGWNKEFAGIEKQIRGAMNGLSGSVNVNGNVAGGFGGMQPAPAAAPIYVTVQADLYKTLDMHVLARQVAEEIRRSQ